MLSARLIGIIDAKRETILDIPIIIGNTIIWGDTSESNTMILTNWAPIIPIM